MKRLSAYLLAILWAALIPSCKWISSIVHDGEVIASIGEHKLYRTEVEEFIPTGTSPQDSANLAMQYINSWATGMALQDIAQKSLSKEEKDVSKELESYRQSLLRYRFEQHFINERLDTAVSEKQVEEYYEANSEKFVLERPILKARFMNIAKDSPNLQVLRKLMSSDNVDDVLAADSIAFNSANLYRDYSAKWIDAAVLATEFHTDYVQMLAWRTGNFIEADDADGRVSVAFVADFMKAGQTPPLEFCRERIKDIIISGRKHELLTSLERDLIEEAKENENFVIYSE